MQLHPIGISGAVANGRAKFEANAGGGSPTPEKPLRFMQPRSRQGSPMLPVKTPKVPPPTAAPQPPPVIAPAAAPTAVAAAPTSISCKSGSGSDANERSFAAETATAKTAVISKLLPKMKR